MQAEEVCHAAGVAVRGYSQGWQRRKQLYEAAPPLKAAVYVVEQTMRRLSVILVAVFVLKHFAHPEISFHER